MERYGEHAIVIGAVVFGEKSGGGEAGAARVVAEPGA
jgi:hypothetical protein